MPSFERLLVAVLVGFLIGLDRERAEVRKQRRQFAGVRTFPLIALAAAIPMLVIDSIGPALLIISFLTVAAFTVVSYIRSSAAGEIGATTEMAALATFLLGALAGSGQLLIAGAAGVAVAVLLVAKPRLEGFSRALTEDEISAALELAVISVIILPLVPNRGYGPWQALNPFEIWLVVVLVSALSLAGFVATRLFGEKRGILVTGIVGALVSSTAVTVAMASQSRSNEKTGRLAAAAAVLASTIMGGRVAVFVGAVNLDVVPRVLPVVAAMVIVGAAAAALLSLRRAAVPESPSGAELANPFSLTAALTFGAVYAGVLLLTRAASTLGGERGLYAAAVLGSLVDVDAVSIAFARAGGGPDGVIAAANGINIAMICNTTVKLGIALSMGVGLFRAYVAGALVAMIGAAAIAAVLVARF